MAGRVGSQLCIRASFRRFLAATPPASKERTQKAMIGNQKGLVPEKRILRTILVVRGEKLILGVRDVLHICIFGACQDGLNMTVVLHAK